MTAADTSAPTWVDGIHPTLSDPALEATFRREGYVVFPCLDVDDTGRLRSLCDELHQGMDASGYEVDYVDNPPALKQQVYDRTLPFWDSLLPQVLVDHQVFLSTFVRKWPGADSFLWMHQDWTWCDERRFRSGTFWIPLVDTGPELDNGPLMVLPRSHRFRDSLRGSGTEPWYEPHYDYLHSRMVPLTVPRGHAVLLDSALLHGSPSNNTGQVRPVLAGAVGPCSAELLYVAQATTGERRVFAIDRSFIIGHSPPELDRGLPTGLDCIAVEPAVDLSMTRYEAHRLCDDVDSLPVGQVDRRTFLDPVLQDAFARDGYAVFDLLDAEAVAKARSLYERIHEGESSGIGYVVDYVRPDPAFKRKWTDVLRPIWEEHMPSVLDDYQPFLTSFLMKWDTEGSDMPLHQDWTYVDEYRHRSGSLWVALDDCDPGCDNGPLYVLPGSHRVARDLRGTLTEAWYLPYEEAVLEAMIPLHMKAGQAVLIDSALLHGSPDNRSGKPRLALAAGIAPRDADLIHVVEQDDGQLRFHRIDADFFIDFTPPGLRVQPDDSLVLPCIEVRPAPDDRVDWSLFAALLGGDEMPEPAWLTEDRRHCVRWGPPSCRVPGVLGGPQAPVSLGPSRVSRLMTKVLTAEHQLLRSRVSAEPLVAVDGLPWAEAAAAGWTDFRDEVVALIDAGYWFPPQIDGMPDGSEGWWTTMVLKDRLARFPMSDRCPATMAFLDRIPRLQNAMFSVLGPRALVGPHRGPNRGALRGQLALSVAAPHSAGLQIGSHRLDFGAGDLVVFDDTHEHASWNDGDAPRISLMLEFERPVDGWVGRTNGAVQALYGRYPAVHGSRGRYLELFKAMNG